MLFLGVEFPRRFRSACGEPIPRFQRAFLKIAIPEIACPGTERARESAGKGRGGQAEIQAGKVTAFHNEMDK